MNKELYDAYINLSSTQQASLKHRYSNSPVALRLLNFLSQNTKPAFKTADAVEFIYKNKTENEKYSVLENRYFKLRKKIYDSLADDSEKTNTGNLPEEEALLNRCKHLIAIGDKKEAYRLLVTLEKQCWERNIFELLPAILDNMIFCNQGFNELQKNKPLYKSLNTAIELQYNLNRALMYIRQIYEAFFAHNLAAEKKLFAAVKTLGDKHKNHPRFNMLYHYVSTSYKLMSMRYTNDMQVISRHLAAFNKLYERHPMVPIVIYRVGHAKFFHFHYNQITASYHINKGEFEESYQATRKMFNMVFNNGDPLFKTYKTASLFFNMFAIQLATDRYKDALNTCNQFSGFLRQTGKTNQLLMVNMMRGILYVHTYPQTFKMDGNYLLTQVNQYIHSCKQENSRTQLPLGQCLLYKAALLMLQKKYKNALKIVKEERLKQYLEGVRTNDILPDLLHALIKNDTNVLHLITSKITQRKYKIVQIDEHVTFKWIEEFIKHILQKTSITN